MKSICCLLLFLLTTLHYAFAAEIGKVDVAKLSNDLQGIDTNSPLRFSWKLKSEGRVQMQGSYRIHLADSEKSLTSSENLIWDSGEVQSDQSVYIPYTGPSLKSGKIYFWRVQLKNREKEQGKWSSVRQVALPEKGKQKGESDIEDAVEQKESLTSFQCSDENLNSIFKQTQTAQKETLTSPATFKPQGLPWGAPLQLTARGFAFQTSSQITIELLLNNFFPK